MKKIFKLELCIHVTFVHGILIIIIRYHKIKILKFCKISRLCLIVDEGSWIDSRINSCRYGKSWKYLDRPRSGEIR